MTTIKAILGTNLRRLRKKKGLSLEDAAKKIGVSWVTLQRWETGHSWIRAEELEKVRRFYGVPVSTLFSEGQEATSDEDLRTIIGCFRTAMELAEKYKP